MIEHIVPAVIAMITGGAVLFQRVHNRIADIDKRVDSVELRIAESYVSKGDFNLALSRMEDHMVRIEEKLDELVKGSKR
jgi:tetrahydromethanopterin S-methyltransferase subunit G